MIFSCSSGYIICQYDILSFCFEVLFSFCCRVNDFSTKSQQNIFFCDFLIFSQRKFIDNSDVTCGFSNILTLPDKISKSDITERVITPNLFLNEKSKVSPYLFFKWKKRKSDYNGNKKILIFVLPDYLRIFNHCYVLLINSVYLLLPAKNLIFDF